MGRRNRFIIEMGQVSSQDLVNIYNGTFKESFSKVEKVYCLIFQRRWLEKEVKLISEREWDEQFEDETDCPLCCIITKWVLVIILVCFFLVIPSVMIYVGVTYRYCDDIFTVWLIAGRWYID